MGKYILKRIALAIVTIWAVATITFFLMNLVPGIAITNVMRDILGGDLIAGIIKQQKRWKLSMDWINLWQNVILLIFPMQLTATSVTA